MHALITHDCEIVAMAEDPSDLEHDPDDDTAPKGIAIVELVHEHQVGDVIALHRGVEIWRDGGWDNAPTDDA